MSKLNPQTFTLEGFPEQGTWIGKLFGPLNQFIRGVYELFNNQITVADNLYQEIKALTIVNETTNFPLKFTAKFNKYPEGVLLLSAIDSNGGYPSVNPLITWSFSNGVVSINSISGLTASSRYTVKFLIIYG